MAVLVICDTSSVVWMTVGFCGTSPQSLGLARPAGLMARSMLALGVGVRPPQPSFGAGLPKLCRIQTTIGVRDYGVGSPSGGCQALG